MYDLKVALNVKKVHRLRKPYYPKVLDDQKLDVLFKINFMGLKKFVVVPAQKKAMTSAVKTLF